MAVLSILKYPDPGLSSPCLPVTVFNDALRQLARDLLDTMRAAPGVGITAVHVGVLTRLVVLELPDWLAPRPYVNPELLWHSDETMVHTEGSVSMSGALEEVERPSSIRFRYQDLDGVTHEEEASGFYAICIQHEIDQLDGVFWLKRLSRLKRDRLVRKWQKKTAG